MASSIRIEVDATFEWWRPLVQWVLTIPHLVYVGALSLAAGPVGVMTGVVVLFTGRVPRSLALFQIMVLRQRVRTFSHLWLLRRSSPAFATSLGAEDPGDDAPTEVTISPPSAVPRSALVVRPLVLVPHMIVLLPLGALLDLLYPVLAVVAAVGHGWPPAMARFLVALERWVVTLLAYLLLTGDERPAFGLRAHEPSVEPSPAGLAT